MLQDSSTTDTQSPSGRVEPMARVAAAIVKRRCGSVPKRRREGGVDSTSESLLTQRQTPQQPCRRLRLRSISRQLHTRAGSLPPGGWKEAARRSLLRIQQSVNLYSAFHTPNGMTITLKGLVTEPGI